MKGVFVMSKTFDTIGFLTTLSQEGNYEGMLRHFRFNPRASFQALTVRNLGKTRLKNFQVYLTGKYSAEVKYEFNHLAFVVNEAINEELGIVSEVVSIPSPVELDQLKTPRGTFKIKYTFDNDQDAKDHGYGYYFTHDDFAIYIRPIEGKLHCKEFAIVEQKGGR